MRLLGKKPADEDILVPVMILETRSLKTPGICRNLNVASPRKATVIILSLCPGLFASDGPVLSVLLMGSGELQAM